MISLLTQDLINNSLIEGKGFVYALKEFSVFTAQKEIGDVNRIYVFVDK